MYNGICNVSNMTHILFSADDIEVYFKLYILLYADDAVSFEESTEELCAALMLSSCIVNPGTYRSIHPK